MGFLHVILWILKLIGILLAVVLGILLLAIGLVLFVPLRYRVEGHRTDEWMGTLRLTWLLRLLRVDVTYTPEQKLRYRVRILGFTIRDSQKKQATKHNTDDESDGTIGRSPKEPSKQKKKPADHNSTQREQKESEPRIKQETQTQNRIEIESSDQRPSENQKPPDDTSESKLRRWIRRLKKKLINLVTKPVQIVRRLWKKWDVCKEFLQREENKRALTLTGRILILILKHISPTRLRGYMAFGMEDPATTGYILAILAMFYGKYGRYFRIQPNFQEVQLEAEVLAKGRIRAGRLLWLLLRLWFNKNFKLLRSNFKQFLTDIK